MKPKGQKVAKKERTVKTTIVIPHGVDKKAAEFMAAHRDKYRGKGMSQLVTNALKAYMGIE